MRSLKSFLLLLFATLLSAGLMAQNAKLKKASKLMEDLNFQGAIEIYLDILDKNSDAEAIINIAECYRMLRNSNEMEYWYGQSVKLPNAPNENMLHYARALQMNGKYPEAKEWVQRYLEIDPANISALFLQKACEEAVVENLRAAGALYEVEARKELNSPGDDFGPLLYKDGGQEKLMFVSTRNRTRGTVPTKILQDNWTSDGFAQLFGTDMRLVDEKTFKYKYSDVKGPDKTIKKTNRHIGPITFDTMMTQAYFSATDLDGKAENDAGTLSLKIYKVDKRGKKWTEPKGVVFNDEEYNVTHPSLSRDGTMLYFASDMPGGFGGMDLYVVYLENGGWSVPVNLGPTVNTEVDELFPFIHGEGADMTLYFSSNGHTGLGGFDLYMSKENYGTWMEPTNLGYPVNSTKDDLSFTINNKKTHGYFASNRNNVEDQRGDEIFSFTKLSVSVEVLVFDKNTEMPLEGAEVYTPCTQVKSYTTNPDGKAFLEVGLDQACDFAAEKLGYRPNNVRTQAADIQAGKTVIIQIPLDLERVFDVGGIVADGLTLKPIEGALVRLKSECDGELAEDQILTDEEGYYEFLGIKEGCDYQIIVSKDGFTKGSATFTTKLDEAEDDVILIDLTINCLPGSDNCPTDCPEGYESTGHRDENGYRECEDSLGNKVYTDDQGNIVKKVDPNGNVTWIVKPPGAPTVLDIFYDFDKAFIREDAEPRLEELVAVLQANPEVTVRFTSHTDARGSKGYNKRLSRRRAESVVRYLISSGISKRRLSAKGMGEKVMINDCYDGIPCTEEQHQANRRTEFYVINWSGQGEEIKSEHNMEGIRIDRCTNCDNAPDVEENPNDVYTPPVDDTTSDATNTDIYTEDDDFE